ncbi:BT_3987 domain-containing protein [Arcticibacter sp.]|uniref:BT_3987 domain-containing protein n=1 Tax=Arcticibacter sp. TaxID=1872630 RepID=UPI00388F4B1F
MKNILYVLTALTGIVLVGCSKEVEIELDIPGGPEYAMVYMPQANENPKEVALSITDSIFQLTYSAYLGGTHKASGPIRVKFDVLPAMVDSFNVKNGTSFQLMPEGSFQIENAEAIIAKGSSSSDALKVNIRSKGFIEPFQSYLLPISLTEAESKVNTSLSTAYFIITGSYAPGEVEREKAYAFGQDAGLSLFDFNGKLVQRTPDGELLLFSADENGQFVTPKQIGTGWDVFDMIIPFGGDRFIGRWASGAGDITQYKVSADGVFGASKTIGFGWGTFARIIPYKENLLGIDAAGAMTMYPLNSAGDFDFGRIKNIGGGWGIFKQIIPYQNSLLAIDQAGDMYEYPLSETGVFGNRKKVGSGWDMHTLVVASGTDLLALDSAGDLWRYKFNPLGFWPLKK